MNSWVICWADKRQTLVDGEYWHTHCQINKQVLFLPFFSYLVSFIKANNICGVCILSVSVWITDTQLILWISFTMFFFKIPLCLYRNIAGYWYGGYYQVTHTWVPGCNIHFICTTCSSLHSWIMYRTSNICIKFYRKYDTSW